jgi:thymidylate synthase ThyX
MPVMTRYKEKMKQLISQADGTIEEELFVTKPGIVLLSATENSVAGKQINEDFFIDSSRPEYEQRAEFKSRITYLAFRDEAKKSASYNEKMAKEYQHLSVHGSTHIEFLIAGIALETSLELIAHNEATVGRLTSSNTKAMDDTLYRIQGNKKQRVWQKSFIKDFLTLRNKYYEETLPVDFSRSDREFWNMANIGMKCTALTYSMSLKNFHKLFIGRLSPHGNEEEIQEVCKILCEQLHQEYPLVIQKAEDYYDMNNGEKYK